MQEACKHLAILESRGLPPEFRKLSVNVSAIQFSQKSFIPGLLDSAVAQLPPAADFPFLMPESLL
jgi:EAL domain-containing protein (putative c-di-GMP-specific phosphodiesterase class I)